MWNYTISVDGMKCSMCESHVNQTIRNKFSVKKVTSSHTKKVTQILSQDELDEAALKQTIEEMGYTVGTITKEPARKKFLGIF